MQLAAQPRVNEYFVCAAFTCQFRARIKATTSCSPSDRALFEGMVTSDGKTATLQGQRNLPLRSHIMTLFCGFLRPYPSLHLSPSSVPSRVSPETHCTGERITTESTGGDR